MNRPRYLLPLATLVLASAVGAQTVTDTTGSFDQLSAGNQLIARSLMDAQAAPANGGEIWTLDQIAAAKTDTGWGNVFAQMQGAGLISAKNLGQVVSAYARSTHSPITGSVASEAGIQSASEVEVNDTSSTDRSTDTQAPESDTSSQAGAGTQTFASLSQGNQKIARALMDAQTLPTDGTTQLWTLDQIAAARSGTGWGQVFDQMKSEGLIQARNLGQVVSGFETSGTVTASEATTAATNAATNINADALAHGHGGHSNVPGAGNASVSGEITAAGNAADAASMGISTAEGHGLGLGVDSSVSASDSVTTGSGASVGLGHGLNAGAAIDSGASSSLSSDVGGGVGLGADNGQAHGMGHGH